MYHLRIIMSTILIIINTKENYKLLHLFIMDRILNI